MTIDDYNLINSQLLERFGADLNVAKTIVINNGTKDVFMTILVGGLNHQTPYTFMDGVEKVFVADRNYNSFIDKVMIIKLFCVIINIQFTLSRARERIGSMILHQPIKLGGNAGSIR